MGIVGVTDTDCFSPLVETLIPKDSAFYKVYDIAFLVGGLRVRDLYTRMKRQGKGQSPVVENEQGVVVVDGKAYFAISDEREKLFVSRALVATI